MHCVDVQSLTKSHLLHTRVRQAWALLLVLLPVAKVSAPLAFARRAAGIRIWLTVQALKQSDQRLLTPAPDS
jgi:hypothetical protein